METKVVGVGAYNGGVRLVVGALTNLGLGSSGRGVLPLVGARDGVVSFDTPSFVELQWLFARAGIPHGCAMGVVAVLGCRRSVWVSP